MFNDHDFRDGVGLAGVNSINWARVLAQIVYYFARRQPWRAGARGGFHRADRGISATSLPGPLPRRWGFPSGRLVVATDARRQHPLFRALGTGEYRVGTVEPSISPSMDIQVRLGSSALWLAYGRDGAAISRKRWTS